MASNHYKPLVQIADYEPNHNHEEAVTSARKTEAEALCDNSSCFTPGDGKKAVKKGGAVKDVNKYVDWCPDCGYALFWRMK